MKMAAYVQYELPSNGLTWVLGQSVPSVLGIILSRHTGYIVSSSRTNSTGSLEAISTSLTWCNAKSTPVAWSMTEEAQHRTLKDCALDGPQREPWPRDAMAKRQEAKAEKNVNIPISVCASLSARVNTTLQGQVSLPPPLADMDTQILASHAAR